MVSVAGEIPKRGGNERGRPANQLMSALLIRVMAAEKGMTVMALRR